MGSAPADLEPGRHRLATLGFQRHPTVAHHCAGQVSDLGDEGNSNSTKTLFDLGLFMAMVELTAAIAPPFGSP